jgi:hypothetical protein
VTGWERAEEQRLRRRRRARLLGWCVLVAALAVVAWVAVTG